MKINEELDLDESELRWEFSRASGPGGQNVNKVESRVTVVFDVAGSPSLSEEQRERLQARLANRLTLEGVLRLSSQAQRTREANRKKVRERLAKILAAALQEEKERKPTRTPAGVERRRLEEKRRRSRVKAGRGSDFGPED